LPIAAARAALLSASGNPMPTRACTASGDWNAEGAGGREAAGVDEIASATTVDDELGAGAVLVGTCDGVLLTAAGAGVGSMGLL
jgi:hypothetical protein